MQSIHFENSKRIRLHAQFWPNTGTKAIVICHGFTGQFDSQSKRVWANALAKKYAVLGLDFGGCGQSEGKFEDTTITSEMQDLESALSWLSTRGFSEYGLVGHSLGGIIAACVAAGNPEVKALCTVGAPYNHEIYPDAFMSPEQQDAWKRNGFIHYVGPRFVFDLNYDFKTDQQNHLMDDVFPRVKQPILVIHGTRDELVLQDQPEKFVEKNKNATLLRIEGGDHGLMNQSHEVAEGMKEFFKKHL